MAMITSLVSIEGPVVTKEVCCKGSLFLVLGRKCQMLQDRAFLEFMTDFHRAIL